MAETFFAWGILFVIGIALGLIVPSLKELSKNNMKHVKSLPISVGKKYPLWVCMSFFLAQLGLLTICLTLGQFRFANLANLFTRYSFFNQLRLEFLPALVLVGGCFAVTYFQTTRELLAINRKISKRLNRK